VDLSETDEYRVTEKGESFFEGKMSGAELKKESDLLGRDTVWYEELIERISALRSSFG
jgi:hypothetical protein